MNRQQSGVDVFRAAFFVIGLLVVGAPAARADLIFKLDQDGCTGGCGTGSTVFGTVTLSQAAVNKVHVDLTLNNPAAFVGTGAGYSLGWNIGSSLSSINVSNLTSGFFLENANGTLNTTGTVTPGAFSFSTFGNMKFIVTCEFDSTHKSCGPGASTTNPGPLDFDVTALGLTTNLFAANSGGFYFASDIIGPTGKTGDVAANAFTDTNTGGGNTEAPEPASLALLGTALGLFGLRRFLSTETRAQRNSGTG